MINNLFFIFVIEIQIILQLETTIELFLLIN